MSRQPEELLNALLDGELTAAEQADVEQQLSQSAALRQLYDELRALRGDLESLPQFTLGPGFAELVVQQALAAAQAAAPANSQVVASAPAQRTPAMQRAPEPRRWLRLSYWVTAATAAALIVALYHPRTSNHWEAPVIALKKAPEPDAKPTTLEAEKELLRETDKLTTKGQAQPLPHELQSHLGSVQADSKQNLPGSNAREQAEAMPAKKMVKSGPAGVNEAGEVQSAAPFATENTPAPTATGERWDAKERSKLAIEKKGLAPMPESLPKSASGVVAGPAPAPTMPMPAPRSAPSPAAPLPMDPATTNFADLAPRPDGQPLRPGPTSARSEQRVDSIGGRSDRGKDTDSAGITIVHVDVTPLGTEQQAVQQLLAGREHSRKLLAANRSADAPVSALALNKAPTDKATNAEPGQLKLVEEKAADLSADVAVIEVAVSEDDLSRMAEYAQQHADWFAAWRIDAPQVADGVMAAKGASNGLGVGGGGGIGKRPSPGGLLRGAVPAEKPSGGAAGSAPRDDQNEPAGAEGKSKGEAAPTDPAALPAAAFSGAAAKPTAPVAPQVPASNAVSGAVPPRPAVAADDHESDTARRGGAKSVEAAPRRRILLVIRTVSPGVAGEAAGAAAAGTPATEGGKFPAGPR